MDIYIEIQDKLDLKKLEKIKGSAARGCISSGKLWHLLSFVHFSIINNYIHYRTRLPN